MRPIQRVQSKRGSACICLGMSSATPGKTPSVNFPHLAINCKIINFSWLVIQNLEKCWALTAPTDASGNHASITECNFIMTQDTWGKRSHRLHFIVEAPNISTSGLNFSASIPQLHTRDEAVLSCKSRKMLYKAFQRHGELLEGAEERQF